MTTPLCLALALLAPIGQEGTPAPASLPKPTVDQQVAAEAAAIQTALEAWCAAEAKLKSYEALDGRLRLWADVAASEAKDASKRTAGVLERLDRAYGTPEDPAAARLQGILLQDGERYRDLCDALADVAPAQRAFLGNSKSTTGFTLYSPPITVYYHDPAVQKEAKADHSVAHSFVHLEMWRRFGALPLWLTEGLACAGEDGAWGEVWAYWYREGFVFASSHADWRGKPTQKIVAELQDLRGLFAYSARPFVEEQALLAFAFATFGLDAEPQNLARFTASLREAYQRNNPEGGRIELTPEEAEALLIEAFGADVMKRFQTWWKKPPKWSAKRAA